MCLYYILCWFVWNFRPYLSGFFQCNRQLWLFQYQWSNIDGYSWLKPTRTKPHKTQRSITMTSKWARWRLKSQASRLFTQPFIQRRSKKTSKHRVTGLCGGNSPVTGEFPTQRASNAENVSIWWRHHGEDCVHNSWGVLYLQPMNPLRPRPDGRHFAGDIFKCIFLNENRRILILISLKFISKCSIDNEPIMA